MQFIQNHQRKLNRGTQLNFSLGINWSFRFASQRRKKMVIANDIPHLDIRDWLQRLDLLEYEDSFKKYSGVEELMSFNESDIKDLGVKNSAHRARVVASLVALKGKKMIY